MKLNHSLAGPESIIDCWVRVVGQCSRATQTPALALPPANRPQTKPQDNGGQQQPLSHQQFLSGAGVQAALGGLSYGVNGRPLNGPTSIPYLQPSIFASPKAAAGGRMNSEPPTPTSGASGASGGLAAGRPTAQTPTGRAGALGSPKLSSGYNPVTGAASTPTRRNSGSLASTAPPGSLVGIQRMVEAAGGGLGNTMGRGGAASGPSASGGGGLFGSTQRAGSGFLGSTLGGGGNNLSATMPAATGSRPPTSAGQAALMSTAPAGSRPGTGLAGQLSRANSAVPGLSFSVGSNQSMGARGYQEDYRVIADPTSTPGMANMPNMLLGAAVYDGHGGGGGGERGEGGGGAGGWGMGRVRAGLNPWEQTERITWN